MYAIRVAGHLDGQSAGWFEGLTITLEAGGETLLAGVVVDQPALFGLLKKVRDLGLPLISVQRIAEAGEPQPIKQLDEREKNEYGTKLGQ